MLTQTRMGYGSFVFHRIGVGYITFPGVGPRMCQYALLMSNSRFLMHFQLSIIVLDNSVSHFLEMTMLISYPDSNKNGGMCFLYFQYYYLG